MLKGIDAVLIEKGHMNRENQVGGVETYHPDGHYVGTFLNVMGVGFVLGMDKEKIAPIAAEMALGSQLPDMLAKFDALSLYESKKRQQAAESAVFAANLADPAGLGRKLARGEPIKPTYWTPAEQAHLENVYRGLHGMPATEREATHAYLNREREATAKFIETKMHNQDWLAAGVAIHRFGDLYAHVRPDGRPYWGDIGHGHEDAKGKLGKNTWGRSPDLLFYKANFDRYTNDYMPALQAVLTTGLKNAKLAKNDAPTDLVQKGASKYFRDIIAIADRHAVSRNWESRVTVTDKYHYASLIKREQAFVDFVVLGFDGYASIVREQMAVGGGHRPPTKEEGQRQNNAVGNTMNHFSRR